MLMPIFSRKRKPFYSESFGVVSVWLQISCTQFARTCWIAMRNALVIQCFRNYVLVSPTLVKFLSRGRSGDVPGAFRRRSRDAPTTLPPTFRGRSRDAPPTFRGSSGDVPETFRGRSGDVPWAFRCRGTHTYT